MCIVRFTVMLLQSELTVRVSTVSEDLQKKKDTLKMFCILYLINVQAKCFVRIYILYMKKEKKKLHEILTLEYILQNKLSSEKL